MPFGEYELSPSLIGLSLLPAAHPEAFQRLSVRSSIPCYRNFNLATGRSLGFASAPDDSAPCSDSLSLRLRASWRLALPTTATRRIIMQKARRHATMALRPLVGARFQELFHSSARGAFHLSLTVLVRYRSLALYLALPDGPGGFTQDFSCPALLRIPLGSRTAARTQLSCPTAMLSSMFRSPSARHNAVLQPRSRPKTAPVWATPRSLATTGGIIVYFLFLRVLRCFSSPRAPAAKGRRDRPSA